MIPQAIYLSFVQLQTYSHRGFWRLYFSGSQNCLLSLPIKDPLQSDRSCSASLVGSPRISRFLLVPFSLLLLSPGNSAGLPSCSDCSKPLVSLTSTSSSSSSSTLKPISSQYLKQDNQLAFAWPHCPHTWLCPSCWAARMCGPHLMAASSSAATSPYGLGLGLLTLLNPNSTQQSFSDSLPITSWLLFFLTLQTLNTNVLKMFILDSFSSCFSAWNSPVSTVNCIFVIPQTLPPHQSLQN